MKSFYTRLTIFSINFRKNLRILVNHPTEIFVIFALVFGVLFVFQLPPLNGTDEFTHFPRVYQISQGTFWEQKLPNDQYGGYLPNNINNMINAYRNLSRSGNEIQYKSQAQQLDHIYNSINQVGAHYSQAIFTSVVIYPPWAYIPSVIGVLIAKTLALPLIWYVYIGRIITLLFYIALAAWAIKLLPRGKWFLVALALLPTSLSQASIVSADGLVNGLSWLIIAYTLAVFARKVSLNWQRLVIIFIASLWLSVIKDGYTLIAILPLVIPIEFLGKKLYGWLWRISSFIIIGTVSLLFAIRTSHVAASTVLTPRLNTYINSKAQFHFIVNHLLLFTSRVLVQPFTKNYDTVYEGFVGIVTSRLVYLSLPIMGLLYLVLFLSISAIHIMPEVVKYKKRLYGSAFVIIVGTYFLVSLAFYVGNTQVGASDVFGVYGRYFLPFIPIIIVYPMVSSVRLKLKSTTVASSIIVVILISLISTLLSIG